MNELITNRSVQLEANKFGKEMKEDKKFSFFPKSNVKQSNGNLNPGNLTAQGYFDLIQGNPNLQAYGAFIAFIYNLIMKYVGLSTGGASNSGGYANETNINVNNIDSQTMIELLNNLWTNQIYKLIAKLIALAGFNPYKENEEYNFEVFLPKTYLSEARRAPEELAYMVRNNQIDKIMEYQLLHDVDRVKAKEMLDRTIKVNKEYEDTIFQQELLLKDNGTDGHNEDIADQDKIESDSPEIEGIEKVSENELANGNQ